MITPRPNISNDSAGYTLLELLVVMTIVALVASVAFAPITAGRSDTLRLRAAAAAVAGALRATRASAIFHNNEATLVIDVDRRTFQSSAVPLRSLPSGIIAKLRVASPERLMPSRAGIRFYPDGTSTGGDIRLSLRGKEVNICLNWLTGEPRLGKDC